MKKLIKTCLILFVVSLFIFGIFLIIISYLPLNQFNEVKVWMDSFARDGDFAALSIEHRIMPRFIGIILCSVIGAFYIIRKNIYYYVSNVELADFLIHPKFIRDLISQFARDLIEVIKTIKPNDFLINPKHIWDLFSQFIRDLKDAIKKEDKIHTYAFMFIFLLGIAIRIFYLFQTQMSDETTTFETRIFHRHGLNGFIQLFTQYYLPGDHMFQTFLSYLSFKFLGGEQYWPTRLPALFAGILLVPAIYMVVRILYDKYSALLASSVIAASSYHIFFSTKARGYSMLCLFFMLILALGTYLNKNNKLAGWHLFAILTAFAFYTMPLMLYPYGIVITWLLLSIVLKDTPIKRSYLLKNLFISITLTILLTFLLYSPVIFLGTGLKSIFSHSIAAPLPWSILIDALCLHLVGAWETWNRNIPDIIIMLFTIGVFISVFFNNRISSYRVHILLAVIGWLIPMFIIYRVSPEPRHWIFLLPIYIMIASAGLTYLLRPVEKIFGNYKSSMFAVLTIVLTIVLMVNKVKSEAYLQYMQFHNKSGTYIDFVYMKNSLFYHMASDSYGMNLPPELFRMKNFSPEKYGVKNFSPEKYGMDSQNRIKPDRLPKILTIFTSQSENDFWMTNFHKYGMDKNTIVSDLNSYLFKNLVVCNRLFLMSSESVPVLQVLLAKRGISVSDYSIPQLIHQYEQVNLYKIINNKGCG